MPGGISARTAIEYVAVIGALIAYFGGSLPSSSSTNDSLADNAQIPVARVSQQDRSGLIVYPDPALECPRHDLEVRVFSSTPLIVYFSNFVTEDEAKHVIEIAEGVWTPSTIMNAGKEETDDSIRKSHRAQVDRDHTVKCLEARAMAFQGWPRHTYVERLMAQRYGRGGHYSYHYDWVAASPRARRTSTFNVYLDANCTGGATHFPLLDMPDDPRWCDAVDCSDAARDLGGVSFLPRSRAAVYWENFDGEGRGWKEGLHAGMPVTEGYKIGLNIWSWYERGLLPEQVEH